MAGWVVAPFGAGGHPIVGASGGPWQAFAPPRNARSDLLAQRPTSGGRLAPRGRDRPDLMTVPTYDQFAEPLLRYLVAHPAGVRASDAHEAVAEALGLSDEQREERLPSGIQPVYKNRNGWAQDRLKRAGFSTSPSYGVWKATPEGVTFAKQNPQISTADLERIAKAQMVVGKPGAALGKSKATTPEPAASSNASPDDRIDAALVEIRESVGRDLLERISLAPPDFFERVVLDLLHAMGYGADRSSLRRVGGSGDGGIDGIISMDRLGLDRVYVQAKRWKNPVGSPEIQGFMGALQLQNATRGVFLTTSTFTKDARDAASRAHGRIVLVDGVQLSALLMDHQVAVTHKALKIPRVDGDYFEEG